MRCPACDRPHNLADAEETGLTSHVLANKLATLPCRKVVILDACHSGEATTSLVRNLTPEEARALARRVCGNDAARMTKAESGLSATPARSYSVAQVYRACAI